MSLKQRLRKERKMAMRHNQVGGPPQMKIDASTLAPYQCKCGEEIFMRGYAIKKVPRLLSPNGQAGMAEIGVVKICYKCGEIYPIAQILKEIQEEEIFKPVLVGADGKEPVQ